MVSPIEIVWDASPTDFAALTNLNSMADNQIWHSGETNDASPSNQIVRISYSLVFNATPIQGDFLAFFIALGDEASSNEIWDGGISASEGKLTVAANISAALAAFGQPAHQHAWRTDHGVTFKGHFDFWDFGPSWQLCIHTWGEALAASGHIVRYRYGTPQV